MPASAAFSVTVVAEDSGFVRLSVDRTAVKKKKKNSLSREAFGFIAVCFSCDEIIQLHRFVWAAPDAPSPGPPRAGRPITTARPRARSSDGTS